MAGFLSVLAQPVHAPHLRQSGVAGDAEPFAWAYSRVDAILAQARRQDESTERDHGDRPPDQSGSRQAAGKL